MRRLAAGVAALMLIRQPCVARADSDPPPYEAVRTLQRLQDRIAVGDTIAQTARVKAMQRTAQAFSGAKLATWNDKRNARALIVYLFSGGAAAAIDEAIPRSAVAPEYEALYAGALAYGLGEDDKARAALMPIDAKTLPSGLGGHLALIQATLAAPSDQIKAIALLDLARLLEPGTLVEEAALRKEMSLIGATGDLDKFALLARRYRSGFTQSIYAGNFRQLVAETAMQLGAGDDAVAAGKLGMVLGGIERPERRRLYLVIARQAAIAGHTLMAIAASEEAGRLAERFDPDEARARVYFGAAAVVDPRYELGVKALTSVAPQRLDVADRALRASALSVAALIRRLPGKGSETTALADGQDTLVADGERALAATDTLIKGATR